MQMECRTFWTGLRQLWTLLSIACNRDASAQHPWFVNTREYACIPHSLVPSLAFLISQYLPISQSGPAAVLGNLCSREVLFSDSAQPILTSLFSFLASALALPHPSQ